MADLVVHQLPGAWGLVSISPFCLKVDAFLRIAGIEFTTIIDATPFGGPKGKLPWIEHNGIRLGDSGFIIEYVNKTFGVDLDKTLSPAQRATSRALRRMIEENLYWAMVYNRWMVDDHWHDFRNVVLARVSMPMRLFIAPMARRGVRQQIVGHGLGIHSADEIYAIGCGDIAAIADLMGQNEFIMGSLPTEIDATVYGFLANITKAPYDGPLKQAILTRNNLASYLTRIENRYFAGH